MKKVIAMVLGACGSAWAGTYTWQGAEGADFFAAANWQEGAAPSSADTDIHLVFPAAAKVTNLGAITVRTMELGGDVELNWGSTAGSFTVNSAISGTGKLTVNGNTSVAAAVVLSGNNTFTGGYYGNTIKTYVKSNTAFGTGVAEFKAGAKNGYPLFIQSPTTLIANEIYVGKENSSSMGVIQSEVNVELSGTVHLSDDAKYAGNQNNVRVKTSTGKVITFSGEIKNDTTSDMVFDAGNATFAGKITGGLKCVINGSGTITFASNGNEVSKINVNDWGSGDAKFIIAAENPFVNTLGLSMGKVTGNRTLELQHDLTLSYLSTEYGFKRHVSAATPATLTLNDTANRTFGGAFEGAISLTYNADGKTYTITNGNSTTTGKLTVQAGTVKISNGAAWPNVTALEVNGAALVMDDTAGELNSAIDYINIATGSKLNIGSRKVFVSQLTYGGEALPKAVYTKANAEWLEGDGEIEVMLDDDTWMWTGNAGGEWNTPGNWMVKGQAATVAPTASDVLFIKDATLEKPFIVSTDTVIENKLVLGGGQQVILFTANKKTLDLKGLITGGGGLEFRINTGVTTEAIYYAKFYNTANDFAGGVHRTGGGAIYLMDEGVLGTGKLRVDAGSVNGSGIGNATPVNTSAKGMTIANDMWIGRESYNSWNGWWSGKSSATYYLTGRVEFDMYNGFNSEDAQTRFSGSSAQLYFYGPVAISGRLICKQGMTIYFSKPIEKFDYCPTKGSIYADNESCHGHFSSSSNQLYRLYCGGVGTWQWDLEAEDALPGTEIYCNGNPTGGFMIDLGGCTQNVGTLYTTTACNNGKVKIQSINPGTLITHTTTDRTFCGQFLGAASFTYAPNKDTYTYTLKSVEGKGITHSTTGEVTVVSGKLIIEDGNNFKRLSSMNVNAGTLQLEGANITERRTNLRIGSEASVALNYSGIQNVQYIYIDGVRQSMGIYGSEDSSAPHKLNALSGTGLLRSCGDGRGTCLMLR